MDTQADPLLTLGDVCRETGAPAHRVKYAIETYRIEPRQRAGILRLWAREDLPAIKSALARIGNRGVAHV